VTHNSRKHIQECIESILNQTHEDYEIVIVDNKSEDGTIQFLSELKKKQNKIKIIFSSSNLGYGLGNLKGIENCQGDNIAIINPDVILDHNWLKNMFEYFKNNSNCMIISGKIMNKDGTVQTIGGLLDVYGAVSQRKSELNDQEFFYPPGAAFIFKRKILEKIKFDPNIFMYYDDVDFAWQSRLLGYNIGYCEKSQAIHDEHHGKEIDNSQFYNISKNRIYVCAKNYSRNRKIKRMGKIISLILADSIYYSYKFKSIKYFYMFFKAIFWNIMNIKKMEYERKKIQKIRIMTDDEIEKFMIKKSIEIKLFKNKS